MHAIRNHKNQLIQVKLSSSLQRCKQRISHNPQQPSIFQSIKKPIQEVQQIGYKQYNEAMKHMDRFNKYQQQVKQKRLMQNQIIDDSECTFTPRINHNKRYSNLASKFMITSFTQRYAKSSLANNPERKVQNLRGQNIRQMIWGKYREVKYMNNRAFQSSMKRSLSKTESIACHSVKTLQGLKKKQRQKISDYFRKNDICEEEVTGYEMPSQGREQKLRESKPIQTTQRIYFKDTQKKSNGNIYLQKSSSGSGQKRKFDNNVRILYTEACQLLKLSSNKSRISSKSISQRQKSECNLKRIKDKMAKHYLRADKLMRNNQV